MYTERGKQWREVEQFTEEENQVVKLQEGCKASVTHLRAATNMMWTQQQGLTHEHRSGCYEHTCARIVVQM
jgi:hypothetical protein